MINVTGNITTGGILMEQLIQPQQNVGVKTAGGLGVVKAATIGGRINKRSRKIN